MVPLIESDRVGPSASSHPIPFYPNSPEKTFSTANQDPINREVGYVCWRGGGGKMGDRGLQLY